MSGKKISVIIPIYNSEKYLKYNLDSILDQTYDLYEVLMINDGSTDSSEEICRLYEAKDKRFKYFYQKNRGVSSARNRGIQEAQGEYLLFVDSDDILNKNLFNMIISNFSKEYQLLCYEYKKIYNYNEQINKDNNVNSKNLIYSKNELLKIILKSGDGFLWNKVYLKEIITKNKLKFNNDINICEDLLFNIKYIKAIKKSLYLPCVGYGYYQSKNSSYNKRNNLKWYTIYKAYEMIEKELKNCTNKITDYAIYNHLYADCEGIARDRYNSVKYMNIKQIHQHLNKNIYQVLFFSSVSINKKIKLFIYYLFPTIVFTIKRLKMKG